MSRKARKTHPDILTDFSDLLKELNSEHEEARRKSYHIEYDYGGVYHLYSNDELLLCGDFDTIADEYERLGGGVSESSPASSF